MSTSDCCGAEVYLHDLCRACQEHCEPQRCEDCDEEIEDCICESLEENRKPKEATFEQIDGVIDDTRDR